MRVSATNTASVARDSQAARRVGSGSFSLGEGANTAPRVGSAQLQTIGGIDTLVALQGFEDPAERKKRAVRGGRSALDALDTLKLELISGNLDQSALNRLRALSGSLGEETGDPGLDQVMAEIDLRVQVEIAKLSRR